MWKNRLTEIVITPSLPTFSIAFAISSPISLSPFADIVPTYNNSYFITNRQNQSSPAIKLQDWKESTRKQTCAISSDVLIIRALLFKFVTTASTAMVIPRLRSIAFIPAATDLHPSVKIARVRTVAQVVPAKNKNKLMISQE